MIRLNKILSNHFLLHLIMLSVISVIYSCSVEKRLHTKGWNIQWHKQYSPKSQLAENSSAVRSVPIQDSLSLTQKCNMIFETPAIQKENLAEIKLIEQKNSELIQNFDLIQDKKSIHSRPSIIPINKNIKQVNYVDNRWIGFLAISLVSLLVGILLIVFLNPSAMLAYQLMAILGGGLLIIAGMILLVISLVLLGVKTSQNYPSKNNSEPTVNEDEPTEVTHEKIEPETRSEPDRPQKKKGGLLILIGFLAAAILVFFLIN